MTGLKTKLFAVEQTKEKMEEFQSNSSINYVFAANHIPFPNELIPASEIETEEELRRIYDEIIFGKKLFPQDYSACIKKINWTPGVVYDIYDDKEEKLYEKNFFVLVTNGIVRRVYKCLRNNFGAPSTVEPTGTDISPVENLVDGYVWKYMFSISDSNYRKFSTTNFIPIERDLNIESAAIPGAIEEIFIDNGGAGYSNYFSGQFKSQDIMVDGNTTLYALDQSASPLNNIYSGCVIKIIDGPAANEYRKILSYFVSPGKKEILLDKPFTNFPQAGNSFEIYPYVYVFGDGNETELCEARAIINPQGNSVSRVEILSTGRNYRTAESKIISSIQSIVSSQASLRPIVSPKLGHGADPYTELFSTGICLSTSFNEDENGYITSNNDFRTVGVLKNPKFKEVEIVLDSTKTIGVFTVDENIAEYRDISLRGTISIGNNSSIVVGSNTKFDTSLKQNDKILLTNGITNILTNVVSVANSSQLTISSNTAFAINNYSISKIEHSVFGKVKKFNNSVLTLENVSIEKRLSTNNFIGLVSSATSTVDTTALLPISQGGTLVNGNFNTFNQLERFTGEKINSSTFIPDESIYQSRSDINNIPTASLHSFIEGGSTDIIYATNVSKIFNTGENLIGNNSGAEFRIDNKYSGDLEKDSGQILYIENISAIPRSNSTTERIKIMLEF